MAISSTQPPAHLVGADQVPRPLRGLLATVSSRFRYGTLELTLPNDQKLVFEGSEDGPRADLSLASWRPLRRFLTGGALGFSESYLDGDWSTSDLPTLLYILTLNEDAAADHWHGRGIGMLVRRIAMAFNRNTKRGSRRNIYAHYDIGNQFYQRWLDPTMTYSSALFDREHNDLAAAQSAKYEHLRQKLDVRPGQRLLEIGCGWGGFAEHIAKTIGAKVTAITISKAQHDFAAERIQKAGLNDRVQIELRDYRDVEGRYDGIASIEMFEAVGEEYWPTFFGKVRNCLTESGRAALQIITIADRYFEVYRRTPDFIQTHIFPGGMLPSPSVLQDQARRAGLTLAGSTEFGQSYSDTLRRWSDSFNTRWTEVQALGFDDRFRRMWNFYLASCAAAFKSRTTDVTQLSLVRPG
ncbi:MAG: class I SAM-dependent methyltransferase [Geminicoccaceae bacterium]